MLDTELQQLRDKYNSLIEEKERGINYVWNCWIYRKE